MNHKTKYRVGDILQRQDLPKDMVPDAVKITVVKITPNYYIFESAQHPIIKIDTAPWIAKVGHDMSILKKMLQEL